MASKKTGKKVATKVATKAKAKAAPARRKKSARNVNPWTPADEKKLKQIKLGKFSKMCPTRFIFTLYKKKLICKLL